MIRTLVLATVLIFAATGNASAQAYTAYDCWLALDRSFTGASPYVYRDSDRDWYESANHAAPENRNKPAPAWCAAAIEAPVLLSIYPARDCMTLLTLEAEAARGGPNAEQWARRAADFRPIMTDAMIRTGYRDEIDDIDGWINYARADIFALPLDAKSEKLDVCIAELDRWAARNGSPATMQASVTTDQCYAGVVAAADRGGWTSVPDVERRWALDADIEYRWGLGAGVAAPWASCATLVAPGQNGGLGHGLIKADPNSD